jgi:hypothetical protein
MAIGEEEISGDPCRYEHVICLEMERCLHGEIGDRGVGRDKCGRKI